MPETVANLVSTIIPVYNRGGMLREAVESVLAQTYRPIEIVIADDGSKDGAGAVADSLEAAHAGVIRVVHGPNQGPGPARESGRILARGEYIQYLDSDDVLLPRKFELQVSALRQHPDCGAAYGYVQFYGETETSRKPLKWTARGLQSLFPCLLVDRWWTTNCPLYRRSVCDTVGPWTDLRYSQDWEYDARVGALGTRLVHVKEFASQYRQHGGERQTGHGKWLKPDDQVRFFKLLYGHARKAGVNVGCPEMRHFSRWVFSRARQCGAAGSSHAAQALLELAREAAGYDDITIKAVSLLSQTLGWRFTGRICGLRDRFAGKRVGADTMRNSWVSVEEGDR